jgi:hypothetical protein
MWATWSLGQTFPFDVKPPTMSDIVVSLGSGVHKAFFTGAIIQISVQEVNWSGCGLRSCEDYLDVTHVLKGRTLDPEKQPMVCNDCERG